MKAYRFVVVTPTGRELNIPPADIHEANRLADAEGGLGIDTTVVGEANSSHTTIEGKKVMAIIRQLERMPKYKGARIDAIDAESDTTH